MKENLNNNQQYVFRESLPPMPFYTLVKLLEDLLKAGWKNYNISRFYMIGDNPRNDIEFSQ